MTKTLLLWLVSLLGSESYQTRESATQVLGAIPIREIHCVLVERAIDDYGNIEQRRRCEWLCQHANPEELKQVDYFTDTMFYSRGHKGYVALRLIGKEKRPPIMLGSNPTVYLWNSRLGCYIANE